MKKKKLRIAAVILAAGKSIRFGHKTPKQYVPINKKPLILHVVRIMVKSKLFDEIIIVVNQRHSVFTKDLERLLRSKKQTKITFVSGGKNRSQSTLNAVRYLKGTTHSYVLFHDAARPFIDVPLLAGVVRTAIKGDCAVTGSPAIESSATVNNGKIRNILPRHSAYGIQTPECYRFDIIEQAYDRFSKQKKFFADATNLHLVHALGHTIYVVIQCRRNLKITFPEDLSYTLSLIR